MKNLHERMPMEPPSPSFREGARCPTVRAALVRVADVIQGRTFRARSAVEDLPSLAVMISPGLGCRQSIAGSRHAGTPDGARVKRARCRILDHREDPLSCAFRSSSSCSLSLMTSEWRSRAAATPARPQSGIEAQSEYSERQPSLGSDSPQPERWRSSAGPLMADCIELFTRELLARY